MLMTRPTHIGTEHTHRVRRWTAQGKLSQLEQRNGAPLRHSPTLWYLIRHCVTAGGTHAKYYPENG